MYRHTQTARLTRVATALGAVVGALLAIEMHVPALWLPAVMLALIGWVFSSLTIEIDARELRSHFGPGVWRKRYPLADVTGAVPSMTRWWEGWGIRFTTRGMLYNVAGPCAVEVQLRSGRRFRLGTDEPDALAAAIGDAIGDRPSLRA